MSLRVILQRLIWLSMLPLIGVAIFLAYDSIRSLRSQQEREATNFVSNLAADIDNSIAARIAALEMLAESPLADDPLQTALFYREAQSFRRRFDTHVILADSSMQMLFNTRVTVGLPLPILPRPRGFAAAPAVLTTGQPAVGDIVYGTVADENVVGIVVELARAGQPKYLLIAAVETREFQRHLDSLSLAPGWTVSILDSTGETIASRPLSPVAPAGAGVREERQRLSVASALSGWTMAVDIPPTTNQGIVFTAAATLATMILIATMAGVLGGSIAGRRLARSVAALTEIPGGAADPPTIREIADVSRLLAKQAAARDAAEAGEIKSNQLFRATFEQAAVGIVHVATDGHFLRVNQKFCDIVGYERQELLTKTFQEITHPDHLEPSLAILRRALAGEMTNFGINKRYLRKTGNAAWVRLTVTLVRQPSGEPDYFISVVEDITAQKQAADILLVSRERLRLTVEAANAGLTDWDLQTGTIQYSPEALNLLGLTENDLNGTFEECLDLIHPNDRQKILGETGAYLDGSQTQFTHEFRIRHKDGSYRFILTCARELADPATGSRHVVGCWVDVTEQKRIESTVRDSEERFRATFEQAAVGIAHVDLDNRWLMLNQRFCDIVGYDRTELLTKTFKDITHPDDLDADLVQTQRLLAGEIKNYTMDKRYIRKDGSITWIRLTVALLWTPSGESDYFIAVVEDINESREAERRLQQLQKIEAIGQLTGGIAHNFNNLLNVVLGNLELLGGEIGNDAKLQPWIEGASTAALRGATLTRQLLTFSRIQTLAPTTANINEIVNGMDNLLRRTLNETIAVETHLAANPWMVTVDPHMLENALLNLAVNARDAMPDGGRLIIETTNTHTDDNDAIADADTIPGDYVKVTVTDTGTGMSSDEIEKAFEPFFTTKETGKGTGLGLSMVHGFAKQSGGFSTIHSEQGTGTTVCLYFPRSHNVAERRDPPTESAMSVGGAETILVVEDAADVRRITVVRMERMGYRVLQAEDGPSALIQMQRHPDIDMMITDVIMPGGMNGIELARQAQQDHPGLKVLYTSGYPNPAFAGLGLTDEHFDILAKPYNRETLAREVRRVLDIR